MRKMDKKHRKFEQFPGVRFLIKAVRAYAWDSLMNYKLPNEFKAFFFNSAFASSLKHCFY